MPRYPDAMWHPVENRGGLVMSGSGRRIILHTTEGSHLPNYPWPPHLTADFHSNTPHVWQHVDFEKGAYSVKSTRSNCGWSANSRGEVAIQIELIGYARHTSDYIDRWYQRVAEMISWLSDHYAIPVQFPFPFDGSAAAGTSGSVRQTCVMWDMHSGIVGHQHAPAPNDHWDPGDLDIDRLRNYLNQPEGRIVLPLEHGQTSEDVRQLQDLLNKTYNSGISEDAVYGDATAAAVVSAGLPGHTGDHSETVTQGKRVNANMWDALWEDWIITIVRKTSYTKGQANNRYVKLGDPVEHVKT